uniref:Uncharacterized protein n=1 Tax=Phlebotomus kandelakii TaxID=1109342 RepID=A0A6B2EAN9_9DIPT
MSKRCCAKTCFNSQVNDKSGRISYFGVPKYEEYATKWLTAAGRDDLLPKPLIKLVKYFICSDHFEPDCFIPGSKKSILKKQMHPLEIPVPTIFKSNIDKFVPKALQGSSPEASVHESVIPVPSSPRREHRITQLKVINHEDFNVSETVEEVPEDSMNIADYEILEEECREMDEEDDNPSQKDVFANLCRLCAQKVETSENIQLVPIFRRKDIVEMLNAILPNVIQEDDGWPQDICDLCIEKVKLCANLVNSFIDAQENFLHMS